ncbi:MAG TPA: hypothetical protein G4O15_14795 [Dehalococcoidia bacterium]|nr:hypothetical protein [Dehalococcoidia bacterium]
MEQVAIIVKGHIDSSWSDWLGEMSINHTSDGNTHLRGQIRDQAALNGLLSQIFNLGFQLLSVTSERINRSSAGKEDDM